MSPTSTSPRLTMLASTGRRMNLSANCISVPSGNGRGAGEALELALETRWKWEHLHPALLQRLSSALRAPLPDYSYLHQLPAPPRGSGGAQFLTVRSYHLVERRGP